MIQGLLNAYLTDINITTTYETIPNVLAENHQVVIVFRYVVKAFDKVWHNDLKYKVLHLGLPPVLEKTLCNLLENRAARINIGNECSNTIDLFLCGVPYRSLLSPALYIIYTNDLPPARPGRLDIMHADDITQV